MSVAELKQQIHNAVDKLNNAEHLKAVLQAATLSPAAVQDELTDNELSILKEREEQYKRGEIKSVPWEEAKAKLKEKHGF